MLMKKHLLLFASLICLVLSSCSSGGSDDEPTPNPKPTPKPESPTITLDSSISSSGVNFSNGKDEQSVSFTASTDWTLSMAEVRSGISWCTPSATSGSKGDATVKFSVTENTEYDDRSVSVTIKAGTASTTFKIIQKGVEALLVTSSTFEVDKSGGSIEVKVKSNVTYQIEVADDARSWISEANSRALTTKKHKFVIAASEEYDKREGEIYIKSGDKMETVKVYQSGGAVLVLSENEYIVGDAGETITINIKSNFEYSVQQPDVDWVNEATTSRGMSSHTLKYIIAPNETYDVRSTEIVFYDKNSDLKDTVTIKQAQKDAIILSEKEYEAEAKGGTIQVSFESNVEVTVTADCDWIKVNSTSSRSLVATTTTLEISENTAADKRTGHVTISNGTLSETLSVTQKGKDATNGSIENFEEENQEW